MFIEYLDKIRMYGKRQFTFQEIIQDLHISENAAKAGLFRLKKANKIITPIKGALCDGSARISTLRVYSSRRISSYYHETSKC